MMLQMMQVYRNTCDRSVNKKHKKIPKGTTRPPKMNKNTVHASRHTPSGIIFIELIKSPINHQKPPNEKERENFSSSFAKPIIERIKTELWQDLRVLSTLRWK